MVSAYTNAGMSLVDQSMVPFQEAYPMIVTMVFVILAGNTAFVSSLFMLLHVLAEFVLVSLYCECIYAVAFEDGVHVKSLVGRYPVSSLRLAM